jgi:ribosomal protein S18 acetylase RimI-like enzyme
VKGIRGKVEENGQLNAPPSLALRPVVLPDDEQFLYEVYESTRADELAQIPWDEAQRKAFLKMQLNARHQSYRMYHKELDDRIILFKNQRAGRLIVSRTDEEINLVDIALLPEYRGVGIGTALIKDLFAEAGKMNRPVRLQVATMNPQAKRLYTRLGFSISGEDQMYIQMEWQKGRDEG